MIGGHRKGPNSDPAKTERIVLAAYGTRFQPLDLLKPAREANAARAMGLAC